MFCCACCDAIEIRTPTPARCKVLKALTYIHETDDPDDLRGRFVNDTSSNPSPEQFEEGTDIARDASHDVRI